MLEYNRVIIFDGACNLCNASVNYVIKHDPERLFSFAPLQSETGQMLIERHHGPQFGQDTFLLIRHGNSLVRSEAVLEILRDLPGHRIRFALLKITPRPIRDFFYRLIAGNRHRLFGRRMECMVPDEEVISRFLQ